MRASLIQHGERRRFVMSAPIPLRRDFGASQLRGLAKKTKDGPQARRLLALAAIYDGATRTEAAMIGGVGLQIIRDWVLHFNERGPDGLLNGKSPGQPSKLNDVQRQAIARMLRVARFRQSTGVVRWRACAAFSAVFWRSRRGSVATSAAACERRQWPRRATSDWCSSLAAQASFAVPGRESLCAGLR